MDRPAPAGASLIAEAESFIDLMIAERAIARKTAEVRLTEIRAEIDKRGAWTPTGGELVFGAKLAWRNANRCIGRYFWNALEVVDCRNVSGVDGIFEACVKHLKFAFNGGKIRNLVSVFAAGSQATGESPRIWNHQLIRYAGYDDGLGDPMNAEFTARVIDLGWSPPATRSRFDVLPLVIQLPGGAPELRQLPDDAVKEVAITHREYPWFSELGLKWHALPVISDMCLEIGGIRFPCAPFNGYYMGTEIGARNFADEDRYNLLPEIAGRLGLEKTKRTLWKDRALVELNSAVLHSFKEAGVTMVDHHTASAQLMKFVENEAVCGRRATGDWSWLVPPMSGSVSPVFRETFDNTIKVPGFFYQGRAW